MTPKVRALDPRGTPPAVTTRALAPPLDAIDGKRICLVDGNFGGIDRFMTALEGWFADNRPSVTTVRLRWREPFADDPEGSARIAECGDAAIFGIGI